MPSAELFTPANLHEAQAALDNFSGRHLIQPVFDGVMACASSKDILADYHLHRELWLKESAILNARFSLVAPDYSRESEVIIAGHPHIEHTYILFYGRRYHDKMETTDPTDAAFVPELHAKLTRGLVNRADSNSSFYAGTIQRYSGLEIGEARQRVEHGITQVTQRIK